MFSELERGRRLGKYEILTRLSVGGMAEVFLAAASGPAGFRKVVTLKRILPDLRDDEQFVLMFLEEARITAALSHANIAQVFELGEDGDELYLAMEFVPGQDLHQVWKACRKAARRLPIGFACRVIRELCLALHYAHGFTDPSGTPRPIIHRDVSPKNVMVTYQGAVKVIDFGIAKAVGSRSRTRAGAARGTAPYMSPEQVLGRTLDGRSDLFSAGTILHELLTGEPLFGGAHDEAVTLQRIVEGVPTPPREINGEIPEALSAVVVKALAKDPADRYATGREMARAVEAAAGDLLYDEEGCARILTELFSDRMRRTHALLNLSQEGEDSGEIRRRAGSLALTDEPGSSSSVPQTRDSGHAAPAEPELEPQTVVVGRGRDRVLVVDDSRANVAMVKYCLEGAGLSVTGCTDPHVGLQTVLQDPPEVIILDVVMPEMDGFELCRRIREQLHDAYPTILFLSAACSLEERVKGLDVGGDDFIRKPFEPAELAARVRSHLQRAAALRRVSAQRGAAADARRAR